MLKLYSRLTILIPQLTPIRLVSQNANKELITFPNTFNRMHNRKNRFQNNTKISNNRRSDNYEKNFIYRGKSNHIDRNIALQDEEDFNPEKEFELEEDLNLFSRNKNLYHKKVIEEDIKQRKRIKLGIIMKRMKKLEGNQHKYINLLTWDAKEQIKYLHLNDPDYWTVEKIVESFPITEESCRKLLKSRWAPKTLDDLTNHDQKVIKNWKLLAQSEKAEPSGPAINIYEEYKRTNRLALLKNACGLPDVQFQRKTFVFNDSYSIHEKLLCKPGKFSSLVEHNKEEIMRLFNRNKQVKHLEADNKKKENVSSIETHLLLTKQELSKSLTKLSSEIELNDLKFDKNNNS